MHAIVRRFQESASPAATWVGPRRLWLLMTAPVLLWLVSMPPTHACTVAPILQRDLDAASIVVTGVVRILDRNEQREGGKTTIAGHVRMEKPRISRSSQKVPSPIVFPFESMEQDGCIAGYFPLDGRRVRAYLRLSPTRPSEIELLHLEYLDR